MNPWTCYRCNLTEPEARASKTSTCDHRYAPPQDRAKLPAHHVTDGYRCIGCGVVCGEPFEDPPCRYIDGTKHEWIRYFMVTCACGHSHTCPGADLGTPDMRRPTSALKGGSDGH